MPIKYRICISALIMLSWMYLLECKYNVFENLDKKYHLVSEAFKVVKNLFNHGRANYGRLKDKSLRTIDTFLDLVKIMNDVMARELRSAVIKFYKIRYFHDFSNYIISLEDIINITEHCLIDPVEKVVQIREQFHYVIQNFADVRHFETVNKCHKELPDEVAAAHCILHQAVLFNETMQESLVTIVEIKTRQHAQDMNNSLYNVQKCIRDFVPYFFEQLLLDAYTDKCGYLRVVNASIADLVKDKWRSNETLFLEKWSPLVQFLKERAGATKEMFNDPLYHKLIAANLSSKDILKTLY